MSKKLRGIAALGVALMVVGCGTTASPSPTAPASPGPPGAATPTPTDNGEPTSARIALSFFQATWDAATASLWPLPIRAVYEPLISWDDETGEYVPWLAEEYEISDDGLTISFKLREDVVFSDGTKMDADGVVKSLNASLGEGGFFTWLAGPWGTNVTATGEYTLELTTTKPVHTGESLFLHTFIFIPIINPAAIDDPSLVASEPIGTGPYLLDELTPEVSASYVRNPDYWNQDVSRFDEITFVNMADKVAALNALKTDQIDAAEIDPSLAADAEASGLTVNTGLALYVPLQILDRSGENNPPLGDKRVRQALSYAIDRAAIVEELQRGYGSTNTEPFDPNSREYVEGGDDRYAYDPDKARQLLADAGYPDGFTIRIPRKSFSVIDYAPVLEQYFGDVGVTIEWVDTADAGASVALAAAVEVDAQIFPLIFDYTIAAFTNPQGDSWVTQPVTDPVWLDIAERYNGSQEEHEGVLDEAAEYVLEQAWYIVISHPDAIWASNSAVEVNVVGGMAGAFIPRLSWFSPPE